MAFDEKFRFIFDVVGDKAAAKSFAEVGKSADKAGASTGALGKSAGASASSFGVLAAKAAPFAGIAASIGTAAFAAANKFQDLAIAAGKMSKATGLAIEDASRWIEVAGDVGIQTGTIETAFAKMDVALSKSPAKFEALGIAIAQTVDGAVDVNATFLNVIEVLNGIENPMKRAEAASQIFGRGFVGMAEITGLSADDLRTKLAAVSDQKVITGAEYDKAVKFREAMDDLKDTFEDVALKLGQAVMPVITALAPVLEAVAVDVGLVSDAFMALLGVTDDSGWGTFLRVFAGIVTLGGSELARLFTDTSEAAEDVPASLGAASIAWQDYKSELDAARVAYEKLAYARAQSEFNGSTDASREHRRALAEEAEAMLAVKEATRRAAAQARILGEQWDALLGRFDAQAASNSIAETAKELEKAAKRGKLDPADVLAFKSDTGQAFRNAGMSERTFRLTVLPTIDRGEYDRVAALLDALTKFRIAPFEPRLTTTKLGGKEVFATGGHMGTQGGIVGDAGPEFFQPTSAGRIFTSGELARAMGNGGSNGGGGVTVILNQTVEAGANGAEVGRQTVEAIRQYERMAGAGWRN